MESVWEARLSSLSRAVVRFKWPEAFKCCELGEKDGMQQQQMQDFYPRMTAGSGRLMMVYLLWRAERS